MPESVPYPKLCLNLAGMVLLCLTALFQFPKHRKLTGWLTIATMVAFTPANYMIMKRSEELTGVSHELMNPLAFLSILLFVGLAYYHTLEIDEKSQ
jgi:uncharacterized membrane protein